MKLVLGRVIFGTTALRIWQRSTGRMGQVFKFYKVHRVTGYPTNYLLFTRPGVAGLLYKRFFN